MNCNYMQEKKLRFLRIIWFYPCFLVNKMRIYFSSILSFIRLVVRYRKYVEHEIHSWAFSYLIANFLKYFHRKVTCFPWNHTMCQIKGTHTTTEPPYCAVSHATLMQPRRFDNLSLFIIILFRKIPAHPQGVCAPDSKKKKWWYIFAGMS